MYKIAGKSDTGKARSNNEDAYAIQSIWDDKHILGVVIDGVGGYDGGERASEIAKETIVAYLEQYTHGERLTLLKQAVVEANNNIVEERFAKRQYPYMSCVLTACLVEVGKKQINMVHVGDTRLYQYHRNELKKLSHDHSLIGYREEIGNLSEEEAMHHPQRNLIDRLLGDETHQVDDPDFLETATFPLLPNSTLLLCTDGLCDMLTSAEIMSVLKQDIPLEDKLDRLVQMANDRGGKDNITVILIECLGEEVEPGDAKTENGNIIEEVVPNKVEIKENQPGNTTGKKKRGALKAMFFLLLAALCGFVGGWLLRERYSGFEQSDIYVLDSVVLSKDTVMTELDDSSAIILPNSLQGEDEQDADEADDTDFLQIMN